MPWAFSFLPKNDFLLEIFTGDFYKATLEKATALKLKLKEKYQDKAWYAGIGIAMCDEGQAVGYAVRINVKSTEVGVPFPEQIDGVPVAVVVVSY